MTNETQSGPTGSPDKIDVQSESSLEAWSAKFSVTSEQLKDAVAAVGDLAGDVGCISRAVAARRTRNVSMTPIRDAARVERERNGVVSTRTDRRPGTCRE